MQTISDVERSMKQAPTEMAEIFIEQQLMIADLTAILEQYKQRGNMVPSNEDNITEH